MLSVVLVTTNLPQIGLEGLATVGRVFLLGESLLVSGDGLQVLATSLDQSGYGGEACTCELLVLRDGRGTLRFLAEVHAVTVVVFGGCYAVQLCNPSPAPNAVSAAISTEKVGLTYFCATV